MPTVDVNPLLNQARCYDKCIPPGMQRSVMISILANMWANNAPPCTPCPDCPTCPDCTGEPFTFNPAAVNPLDLLGLFTYGELIDRNGSVYNGELILNATVCVPGYDIEATTGLTAIRAPNLVAIDPNNAQSGYFTCSPSTNLLSIDLGSLVSVAGNFNCLGNSSLTSIDVGSLTVVGRSFRAPACALASLDLSSITSIGGDLIFSNNPNLTSILVGNMSILNGNLDGSGCILPSSVVNSILAQLVPATTDGFTPWANSCDLSGQTPAAPPTGQGILDAATLTGRGAIITTD